MFDGRFRLLQAKKAAQRKAAGDHRDPENSAKSLFQQQHQAYGQQGPRNAPWYPLTDAGQMPHHAFPAA
jgi:hypothetical protein